MVHFHYHFSAASTCIPVHIQLWNWLESLRRACQCSLKRKAIKQRTKRSHYSSFLLWT